MSRRLSQPRPVLTALLGVTVWSTLATFATRSAGAQDANTARADTPADAQTLEQGVIAGAKLVQPIVKVVSFDPKTRTAIVRLRNPTTDTAVVELTTQFVVPNQRKGTSEALLVEDSIKADSIHVAEQQTDSLAKLWSLTPWVREVRDAGKRLWLAPKQVVRLTLHLDPPASLPPGEYWGYLVVIPVLVKDLSGMAMAQYNGMSIDLFGGKRFMTTFPENTQPRPYAKLVYRVGGKP